MKTLNHFYNGMLARRHSADGAGSASGQSNQTNQTDRTNRTYQTELNRPTRPIGSIGPIGPISPIGRIGPIDPIGPIGLIGLIGLACGCTAQRAATAIRPEVSQLRIVSETVLDTLQVHFDLPQQSAERATVDSLSRLTTDYAESEAQIMADGTLRHTLVNAARRVDMAVAVEHRRDSVVSVVERTATVEVAVEKELTWWQRVRLWAFWPLAAVAALAVGRWLLSARRRAL